MMTQTIMQNLITFLAPVVGIAILIFCVIQAIKIFSGNESGSVKKLIGGVLVLFLILGIMYAVGSFSTIAKIFQGATESALTKAGQNAKTIVG